MTQTVVKYFTLFEVQSEKEKENKIINDPVYHVELDFSHSGENITDSDNCPPEQSSIECEYRSQEVKDLAVKFDIKDIGKLHFVWA